MDRALSNVANAMPRAGTRGIISSFEAVGPVGDHDGKDQPRVSLICASACVLKQRVGMRRSGALTLGAVLMLGGVTGGRGQELSGAVTSSGPSFPSFDGVVLPTLPENWSDLPVRLTASQSVAIQQQYLCGSPRLRVAAGRCARRFCLHNARWPFDQALLVWSAVFLRRLVWRDTLSSPGRFQLGYVQRRRRR